ncbi:glycosyltransferase family 2 protein [Sulfitobacter sp. 1A13421]|uniref:glycosyltransferase family 2 protein n=1 Tax=Sulfitobacter sp. 1A13421 TaxID=3368595 RepID=UPI0037450CF4
MNSLAAFDPSGLKEGMKICAITMVYRDYWALSQWYAHYSRHLGSEHLYIVSHGNDPKVSELCPRASVITVPRGDLTGFDRLRAHLLNGFQDGLGALYDWVIRTDADELICFDPERYANFSDLFASRKRASALFALGMNLAEIESDPTLTAEANVLHYRREAHFSGHYSKAWAVRRGTHLVRHGIQTAPERLDDTSFTFPKGVYLVHLKYANSAALIDANQHRTLIGNAGGKGLPGKAWAQADQDASRFYAAFRELTELDWPLAERRAYRRIKRDPVRDEKLNVLRARSVKFPFRTTLPKWFENC